MSTNTTETPDTTEPSTTPESTDRQSAAAEARKYRQRAQEAESERDALRDRMESLSRQSVERIIEKNDGGLIAGMGMHAPADLWTIGGVSLADVSDENGEPDVGKITEAVQTLQAARPYLFKIDPLFAVLGSGTSPVAPPTDTGSAWSAAMQKSRQGTL